MSESTRSILVMSLIAIASSMVCAQVEPTKREPLSPEKRETLPTLDELLGLESESTDKAPVEDANDAALDAVLSPRAAGEAFAQAVTLMDQVALRIRQNKDLSIATQRLQEDILTKLDRVIESAQSNNSGGGGSSSSSSQSSSNQNQPDQQQSEQQSEQQGDGTTPSTESGDAPMPGGNSNAQPGAVLAPDGVRWGALPKRIRDALSQGISDQYSELYRAMTQEYYKKLAEDER